MNIPAWPVGLLTVALALPVSGAADIPRTPEGRPDFSGTYDIATLTPLERPEQFGDKLHLTLEEAQRIYLAREREYSHVRQVLERDRA